MDEVEPGLEYERVREPVVQYAGEIFHYATWEESVHERVKREPIWQFLGYRKALYIFDLAREDCQQLNRDVCGKAIAQQLIRSSGSISANLEEGHGRGYGKQRDWFFKVAIGSARETKGWYRRAHRLLSADTLNARLALLDEIIGALIGELQRQSARRFADPLMR